MIDRNTPNLDKETRQQFVEIDQDSQLKALTDRVATLEGKEAKNSSNYAILSGKVSTLETKLNELLNSPKGILTAPIPHNFVPTTGLSEKKKNPFKFW